MTVSTTNADNSYTANGTQTVFPFTYQILTDTNGNPIISTVGVYLNGAQQVSGFTTVANSDQETSPGGTVTFNTAPAAGTLVNLPRQTPLTQDVTFPLEAKISTPAIENALDKATLLMQENEYQLGLKPSLPTVVDGGILAYTGTGQLSTINPNTAGYALVDNGPGNAPSYQPVSAATGGNVVGPAAATTGALATFADTTGKTLANGLAPTAGTVPVGNGSAFVAASISAKNIRLYCVSGSPDDAADHSAVATLYAGPYGGNALSIAGALQTFSEVSLAVPATTSQMYSVFAKSGGVSSITLSAVAWTNDTTPGAAATAWVNGEEVLSTDHTKLLIGWFRTGAVAGQTNDTAASRLVLSYYNPLPAPLYAADTTASWTYATAAWRAADANTTVGQGRVELISTGKRLIRAQYSLAVRLNVASATPANFRTAGLALDGSGAPANAAQTYIGNGNAGTIYSGGSLVAGYSGIPAAGYHYLQAVEFGTSDTGTMYGVQNSANTAYIAGEIWR